MEIESLMQELSQQFAVDDECWHPHITLGEILGMMESPMDDSLAPEHEGQ